MRLKSIKLAGFKSFVDPTTVHFPSNMSAVVGPNGCGKSNIIDAVRWVMGESSAKNLRGESMTDVIFNGSNARKPVGQATIELIFDNTDKTVTGEYAAFNEISIRRKVTREGESSYFLNGTKCRRRDITDIFLGTGLGPRSYAIIEQGMISKLIEAKPEELRVFIEEAAGISRYKERRRDTENRIRRTRENLERLTDIRDELERQLQHLNRQAKTAERYKLLKTQERENTALLRAIQWQSLQAQKTVGDEHVAEHQVQLEAALANKVKAETGIEKQRLNLTEQSDTFNSVQSEYYRLGADIARNEQRMASIQDRDMQLRQDIDQAKASLDDAQQHISSDQAILESTTEELLEIEPELEELKEKEVIAAETLDTAQVEMQDWQSEWEVFNASTAAVKQQAEVEQSRIQYVEQSLRRSDERATVLADEKSRLLEESFVGDIEPLAEAIEILQEQLASKITEAEITAEHISNARSQLAQSNDEIAILNTQAQQSRGRLSALEALQQNAVSQGDDAEEWFKESNLQSAQRLADNIKVEGGWEKAVETVLGQHLQAVVVDDFNEYLAKHDALPAAGVTLFEKASNTSSFEAEALASKVSGGGAEGLLAGVWCAASLDEAIAKRAGLTENESVITADGIWMGRNWLRMLNDGDDNSVLQRQAEIDQLQQQLSALDANRVQCKQQQADVTQQLASHEQQQKQCQQDINSFNQQLNQQSSELSAMKAREEKVLARQTQLDTELEQINAQLLDERETLSEHRMQLQDFLDSMAEQMSEREERIALRDVKREQLEAVRDTARSYKDQLMSLSIRHQSLKTQRASVQQTSERMASQLTTMAERSEMLQEQLETNREPLEEITLEQEEMLQKRLTVEADLTAAREQMSVIENDIREKEAQRNQADQQAQNIRNNLEQMRLSVQTLTVQLQNIEQQISEMGHTPELLLSEVDTLPSEAELTQGLTQLQATIARLGAINLAAIDEYDQQSERKLYLDAQNEDLLSALDTLENAIRKIDRETRSRFKDTFDEVNTGLTELFPQVFGGGQAYLELTGDDLLDTGIAIMARPPGKKNSTIHLLSGGEKALTAIALVFAIFRLNPAPFCMLDEVDAPLDDANVGRYARLVKSMSAQVQFIYITHNKIPMEFADQLMGVTMHEPGVSRLVTVDIEKAAELAAL